MRQSFYIEVDKADLKYVMKKLQNADKNAPRVIRNAINRTATQTMKMFRQGRSQGYVIKAGAFNKKAKIQRANASHLDATITFKDGAHGILKGKSERYYKVSGKGSKGAVYKGGMKEFGVSGSKAFLATMKSGHEGIFQRKKGSKHKSPDGHELPIREVVGPGVAKMALKIYKGERGGQGDMEEKVKKRLHEEIEKEIAKLI